MNGYLEQFYKKLKKWKGSLVKVKTVKKIEPNAKKYLNNLAKTGRIKRTKWGWYWIPDSVKDMWDFLVKDKNFKLISAQSAASFWNYDFVHRDVCIIRVKDKSYGKALKEFGRQNNWKIEIEHMKKRDVKRASGTKFVKIGNLFVEGVEDTIIDCLQNWAFTDAFATLYANRKRIRLSLLFNKTYWKRISGTNIRVKQVLEYGCHRANELVGKGLFPVKRKGFEDEFVRRHIDEAVERVVELG